MLQSKFKITLVLAAIASFVGLTVLALFAYQSSDIHVQKPKSFYLGSDFLTEDASMVHHLYGGGEQSFTFELKNYIDSLRISDDDLSFTVTASGYENISISNATGILEGKSANQKTITVTIPGGYEDGTELLITAESMPYYMKMSAKLILHASASAGNYYVEDSAESLVAKLTICADNAFSPNVVWSD